MAWHYTQGTESVTKWCNRCSRHTQHAVSGNRVGRCLEHSAPELTHAQQKSRARQDHQRKNPSLFPESQ